MLEKYMVFPCTLYPQTVDEYNSIRLVGDISTFCHFRDGQTTDITGSAEVEISDAMAWFLPDQKIKQGDVIAVDGYTYRIQRIVHARRLGSRTIQFIKCYLERLDATVS